MTPRKPVDDERIFQPQAKRVETDGTPLFDAPSVPIASSERGADAAAKHVATQNDRIILALRAAGCIPGSGKYLSREAIQDRAELTVNAACGRLGPSGRLVIEGKLYTPSCAMPVIAVEDAAVSSAGLSVLGYQLTAFGVEQAERLTKARAA